MERDTERFSENNGNGSERKRLEREIVLLPVKIYRRIISPLIPPSCRFEPTCSQYAITAVTRFGIIRGGYLTVRRLIKCHPFNKGGYDPVPKKEEQERKEEENNK